jgi:hypothetical protein
METPSSATLRELPATFRAMPTFAPFADAGFLGACFTKSGDVDIAYLADLFRMSKTQLAETVGLPLATVIKTNRMKAPKAQGRMTEMLEIIARIKNWAGGALSFARTDYCFGRMHAGLCASDAALDLM